MDAPTRKDCGFTTIELLVVVVVVGILTTLAVPSFGRFRESAGLGASANQMLWALHYARSTAISRNRPAVLCLSADGERCLTSPSAAGMGWIIFSDANRTSPVQLDAGDEVLRRMILPRDFWVRGTRAAVTYWPTTRGGTTSTFTLCSVRNQTGYGRSVVVSQTGRPRVAGSVPCVS